MSDTNSPCVGCENSKLCLEKELACDQYRHYASLGYYRNKSKNVGKSKIPSKENYNMIYSNANTL
jgi:hypothetical protein